MDFTRELQAALDGMETLRWSGHVRELVGMLAASDGPAAAVGDFCEIRARAGRDRSGPSKVIRAQVVGFAMSAYC